MLFTLNISHGHRAQLAGQFRLQSLLPMLLTVATCLRNQPSPGLGGPNQVAQLDTLQVRPQGSPCHKCLCCMCLNYLLFCGFAAH